MSLFFCLFTFTISLWLHEENVETVNDVVPESRAMTSRRPTGLSVTYHGRRVFIGRLCPRLFVRTSEMFQESPCTGADRRELRCSCEVKEAPSSEVPAVCHWLCFLYGQKGVLGRFTWQSAEQCQRQTENFWRRSIAFSSVRTMSSLSLPGCLLTVPVSQNFLNSLLTPRFV